MAIRPDAEQILRGIRRSLAAHVLPEISTPYATAQVQYAMMLLGAVADEWDGAAQRLVADNAAMRALAATAAGALRAHDSELATELEDAAAHDDTDLHISALAAANDRLRGLLVRIVAVCTSIGVEPAALLGHDWCQTLGASVQHRRFGAL